MAPDTMLAAEIEQQLKPLDAAGRAQFPLDLVEVGEAETGAVDTGSLDAVREAARAHVNATS